MTFHANVLEAGTAAALDYHRLQRGVGVADRPFSRRHDSRRPVSSALDTSDLPG